jgi:hypothetical protein
VTTSSSHRAAVASVWLLAGCAVDALPPGAAAPFNVSAGDLSDNNLLPDGSPSRPRCDGLDAPCDALPLPLPGPACGARSRVDPAAPFPARLSTLGCLTTGDPYAAAEGVIPYEVAAPLFSEGSAKARFLGLPAGSPLTPTLEGPWQAAEGTVVLKTFGFSTTWGATPTPV